MPSTLSPQGLVHGLLYNSGCRCAPCREGNTDKYRAYRDPLARLAYRTAKLDMLKEAKERDGLNSLRRFRP